MTVSFRTRLFVVAGLIVGAVLSAVLLLGYSRVLGYEVQRLEERLCAEARRLLSQPFHGEDLPRLNADIVGKLHLDHSDQLMLRFETGAGADNGVDFQSSNWHAPLAMDSPTWQPAKAGAQLNPRPPPPQDEGAPPLPADRPFAIDPPPPDGQRPPPDASRPPPPGSCALASFTVQGHAWRAARYTAGAQRSVVAADLLATEGELTAAMAQAMKLVVPLAVLLTALGAWLLASLTMRPVDRLRSAMQSVTQKALDQRLPSAGEDTEFKALIEVYNTMLARLEASFLQASRFSSDAAHELKTPLTILQGRIELALGKAEHTAMHGELTELQGEVGRLAAITRKLLLLSQADAGHLALKLAPIDLSAMLDDMAADAHMLITDLPILHPDQASSCSITRGLAVQGDALLLRQLFNNLVSNALRYRSADGWITLSARDAQGGVEVVFANACAPIAPSQRGRFFERFYRGDASHNRSIDGNGLGLSLAREIAKAHGGELGLLASAQDEVQMRVWLPAVAMQSQGACKPIP